MKTTGHSGRGVPFAGESLVEMLRHRAETQPHDRAYTFLERGEVEGAACTWAELDRQARAIAVSLRAGLSVGDRAVLLYPPGLDFVAGFFGCLYAGVIAVPTLPPQRSRSERGLDRLLSILRSAGAKAVLTTGRTSEQLSREQLSQASRSPVDLVATDAIDLNLASGWTPFPLSSNALAFLQYTSGSTMTPKGVMVSHANLLDNLGYGFEAGGSGPDTVSVSWLPVTHDMGLIEGVLQPAYSGSPAYLMSPAAFLQRPVRWLHAISRYRGTRSGGPNFAYDLAVSRVTADERKELDLSRWSAAYNGAEPVRADTMQAFAAAYEASGFQPSAFRPCYGLAEATLLVSSGRWDRSQLATPVSCGTPARGTRVRIADPTSGRALGERELGEILVAGGGVTHGYWNDEEETRRAFVTEADTRWLRTGDLGFVVGGQLYVTGRLKDLLIVRGAKLFPQDVERTVEGADASIRRGGVTAVAVASGVRGDHVAVIAEVDPTDVDPPDGAALISSIREAVTESHGITLHAVLLVSPGSVPKTTSGKPRRYLCREAWMQRTLEPLAEWCEATPALAAGR